MAGLGTVAIVGAGSVGTALAYATLLRGGVDRVVLFDRDGDRARAEALDLAHGSQFVHPVDVVGDHDVEACAAADVVVVTAGAKQRPGQSRLELAAANASMVRELVPRLVDVAPDALFLIVSNPVDVLTWVALDVAEAHGVQAHRVFGSGTVLDTSRLRFLLAERLGIAATSVHAHVVGEHGDTSLPVWSGATVGGAPIAEVADALGRPFTHPDLDALAAEVRGAAGRIIAGKGATSWAVGLAVQRILAAVGADEHAVLPVSWRHVVEPEGEVCLSLPVVVGRSGVLRRLPLTLDADERTALQVGALAVRRSYESL